MRVLGSEPCEDSVSDNVGDDVWLRRRETAGDGKRFLPDRRVLGAGDQVQERVSDSKTV